MHWLIWIEAHGPGVAWGLLSLGFTVLISLAAVLGLMQYGAEARARFHVLQVERRHRALRAMEEESDRVHRMLRP